MRAVTECWTRRPTRVHWIVLASLVPVAAGALVFIENRAPGQREVDVGVLAITSAARIATSFVDCTKVNTVSYEAHQPCQDFVLLVDRRAGSLQAFYRSEEARLLGAGWRQTTRRLLLDNDTGTAPAPGGATWAAPRHRACADVITDAAGLAAERKAVFPYDPYDIPHGVYRFYREAKAASRGARFGYSSYRDTTRTATPLADGPSLAAARKGNLNRDGSLHAIGEADGACACGGKLWDGVTRRSGARTAAEPPA
jgi:hypothetical protein